MSLQRTITVIFFISIFILPFTAWRFYLNSRPKSLPIQPREEVTITIIPGWNLRDVADYFVKMGIVSSTKYVFALTGEPATIDTKSYLFGNKILAGKGEGLSLEGYLAPETYRVFRDAALGDVVEKLIAEREKEFLQVSSTIQDFHQTLTMASLIEKETRTPEDRRLVADILWRRLKKGWALQLDSSVHYAVDKTGTVFTTDKERDDKSLWNTYKYPGLPPGPICNPSFDSVEAAITPVKNDYWYFLSGNDGKMYYAKTLEEHTANRYKYLR
ncbi:MAG: endolytic transglycosylase MltG [Patescibacteria group bacterium]|jgi:UPF0755 protein